MEGDCLEKTQEAGGQECGWGEGGEAFSSQLVCTPGSMLHGGTSLLPASEGRGAANTLRV